jgi:hypothetical protein
VSKTHISVEPLYQGRLAISFERTITVLLVFAP